MGLFKAECAGREAFLRTRLDLVDRRNLLLVFFTVCRLFGLLQCDLLLFWCALFARAGSMSSTKDKHNIKDTILIFFCIV